MIPAERNRQPVPLKQISPWLPKATVAIEDRRFYEHGGVDFEGIARALWKDVSAGKVVEGGSTITQQLVRNLYPVSRERTLERKLKEACLAIKLNDAWSKDRILASYMNQVYYGNHAYGVEAAAQTYFSKHASELTLPEAALLAGLPQAPSDYDPFNNREIAIARRNEVLRAMLGNGDIDRRSTTGRRGARSALKAGKLYRTIREPYFFSYVRDELIAEYGASTVRSGGLKVYTTIDPRFQHAAREGDPRDADRARRPGRRGRLDRPAQRRDPAMTAVIPGNRQEPVQPRSRRRAGRRARRSRRSCSRPRSRRGSTRDLDYYLSAPFYYQPTSTGDCDTGAGGGGARRPTTTATAAAISIEQRDAAVRQHRLRPADARRRPGERSRRWRTQLGVRHAST